MQAAAQSHECELLPRYVLSGRLQSEGVGGIAVVCRQLLARDVPRMRRRCIEFADPPRRLSPSGLRDVRGKKKGQGHRYATTSRSNGPGKKMTSGGGLEEHNKSRRWTQGQAERRRRERNGERKKKGCFARCDVMMMMTMTSRLLEWRFGPGDPQPLDMSTATTGRGPPPPPPGTAGSYSGTPRSFRPWARGTLDGMLEACGRTANPDQMQAEHDELKTAIKSLSQVLIQFDSRALF